MRDHLPVLHTMALVNQRTEQFMWMLFVSMHWKEHWLMLNRDALSIYILCCNALLYVVNYFYWCSAKYIHAGLQAQFFKKLITFWQPSILKWLLQNKQLNKQKTHFKGSIFHVASLKAFGKLDDMIAKLSFVNLIYSLLLIKRLP